MTRQAFWHLIKKARRARHSRKALSPHTLRPRLRDAPAQTIGADLRVVQSSCSATRTSSTTQIYTHVARERLKKLHRTTPRA